VSEASAKQKAALWVGVVFLLGASLGGVLGYVFAHRPVSAASQPLSEPERRARRVAELTRDLSLTPQQVQQLNAILLQGHSEAQAVRDQSDKQMDEVRQKTRAKIRAILTAEQAPKFENFLDQKDAERKRHGAPPTSVRR
jgi:Spy/CpxP family protein refolding chaperone